MFTNDRLCDLLQAAFENVLAVLVHADAGYRAQASKIAMAYRDVIGSCHPAMSVVGAAALPEPAAKNEIEAAAVRRPGNIAIAVHASERKRPA